MLDLTGMCKYLCICKDAGLSQVAGTCTKRQHQGLSPATVIPTGRSKIASGGTQYCLQWQRLGVAQRRTCGGATSQVRRWSSKTYRRAPQPNPERSSKPRLMEVLTSAKPCRAKNGLLRTVHSYKEHHSWRFPQQAPGVMHST